MEQQGGGDSTSCHLFVFYVQLQWTVMDVTACLSSSFSLPVFLFVPQENGQIRSASLTIATFVRE